MPIFDKAMKQINDTETREINSIMKDKPSIPELDSL